MRRIQYATLKISGTWNFLADKFLRIYKVYLNDYRKKRGHVFNKSGDFFKNKNRINATIFSQYFRNICGLRETDEI